MANDVFYSVGANTSDHKNGAPTCTISGGVMTFSVAQVSVDIVVGDRVTYDTSKVCYLKSKVAGSNQLQWNVVTATGGTPSAEASPVTVNSIAHEYTSVSAAESGASDANHINNTSLVAADVVLNIVCCDFDDTTRWTVTGWTTDSTRYIKIYPATDTWLNCNENQGHRGNSLDALCYRLVPADAGAGVTLKQDYTYIRNIIVKDSYTDSNGDAAFQAYDSIGNIMRGCISVNHDAKGNSTSLFNIWRSSTPGSCALINCAGVDSQDTVGGGSCQGYNGNFNSGGVVFAFNCLMENIVTSGFYAGGTNPADATLINCVAMNCGSSDYNGTFNGNSDYNASGDATYTNADNGNSFQLGSEVIGNFTYTGSNLNIDKQAANASEWIGAGTDLSGHASYPFDDDFNNRERLGTWDIGPSQYHWGAGNNCFITGKQQENQGGYLGFRQRVLKINGVNTETIAKYNGYTG